MLLKQEQEKESTVNDARERKKIEEKESRKQLTSEREKLETTSTRKSKTLFFELDPIEILERIMNIPYAYSIDITENKVNLIVIVHIFDKDDTQMRF